MFRALRRRESSIPHHLHELELSHDEVSDLSEAIAFLSLKSANENTFTAYRRDLERFYLWMWLVAGKTLKELNYLDISDFSEFYRRPGKKWVGLSQVRRFKADGTCNKDWRPFVVSVKKSVIAAKKSAVEKEDGFEFDLENYKKRERDKFVSSPQSYSSALTTINLFFESLVDEGYVSSNPVRKLKKTSTETKAAKDSDNRGKRLSKLQLKYLFAAARDMAEENPERYERSLFIISCMYYMYLRVSDLVEYEAQGVKKTPLMSDFYKDHQGYWWFRALGKGNKTASIAVKPELLEALKRYRRFLGLTDLPGAQEPAYLLGQHRVSKEPIKSTRFIRLLFEEVIKEAAAKLRQDGHDDDADNILNATPHWLRHTGISEDIEVRPMLHVQEDARHAKLNTTGGYSKADDSARNETAQRSIGKARK